MQEIRPIVWGDGKLQLLDQTKLPMVQLMVDIPDYRAAAAAITDMKVRGAPAIGVTAAYAVVLAAEEIQSDQRNEFLSRLREAGGLIAAARPTAVNLHWAVQRMLDIAISEPILDRIRPLLLEEAQRIQDEDEQINRQMGQAGKELILDGGSVLTHCNTGALATSGYGTALGVIRASWESGHRFRVYNTETRPFLQGARLTAWEFQQLGIPSTLIVDSAAGMLMNRGEIDCVITGADRIAANGDTANKIGTYSLAVLAKENSIPFYIVAPTSTVDLSLPAGTEIEIEQRAGEEVTHFRGSPTAPEGITALNPGFDVTPHRYITGIVTEMGVARPPFLESLHYAINSAKESSTSK